ncbi:MAG: hypothetical protein ABFD92_13480 [Planctomycetaceae bacterium]|nr:glycoside hydrolase family 20 zincin-like fold domain-containing protein [Planctomycetaceae bacterium]
MIEGLKIQCTAPRTAMVEKCAELLERVASRRCSAADASVRLAIAAGIGTQGYSIADAGESAVAITGNDERGLLYGVGRFLRDASYDNGRFRAGAWRGTSVPVKPVRAMYFASHFHNFYHDAPIAQVQRYVEELALWGCNALSVWFDMHHYQGIDDPAAREMIDRLRAILSTANSVGIAAGLTTLANEGYANSPQPLRADWTAGHDGYTSPPGGHYHVEICPNVPGGIEQIVADRRQMLEAFADLDIEYVWIWPYDQGGCTCSRCAPWGAAGFLKAAKAEAGVIRQVMPAAKVVLSTWYFDHFTSGEWSGLSRTFEAERPDWVDYLMIDDYGTFPQYPLTHGVPGGFPAVNFPEISMEGMYPWGGFGANPRPAHWQKHWDKTRTLVEGGFPYSEGIYEDINKIILLQMEWSPDRPALDVVREYARYELSAAVTDDAVRLVEALELAHGHYSDWKIGEWPRTPVNHILGSVTAETAARTRALAESIDAKLPPWARTAWRWRILFLRAALDGELTASGGQATEASERYFQELGDIYHSARALLHVSPPGAKTFDRVAAVGLEQT